MKSISIIIVSIFLSAFSFAQKSNFGAGIYGGANFPTGDFDEFYNAGYVGYAQLLYHLGDAAIVSLSVGYNKWNLDVDAFNKRIAESGLLWNFDLNSDFAIVPVLIGVRYYLFQKKNQPYIIFEGGIYNYNFNLEGTIVSSNPGANSVPIEISKVNKSGTETMLNLGLGYLFKLRRHWFLDISARYNILTSAFAIFNTVNLDDEDVVYGGKGTLQYVSILAGINYRF